MADEVAVAGFAKAPIPGYAKTRLIPALGPAGAAGLQERLTERAIATALEARIGAVTLWCAPDADHLSFTRLAERHRLKLQVQREGDLGARMLAAFVQARPQPLVLIGSDCPSLAPADLAEAARPLAGGADLVLCPGEDGGYGLIGTRVPCEALFADMPWGTDRIAQLTLARAAEAGLSVAMLRTIWDVDTPADHARLAREGLLERLG